MILEKIEKRLGISELAVKSATLGLMDLVKEEDLRLEMIHKLGLTLGTESWLWHGISWIWDCGGGAAATAPLGLWWI